MVIGVSPTILGAFPIYVSKGWVGKGRETTTSKAWFLHFGIHATCIYSLCLPGQVRFCPRPWEDGPPNFPRTTPTIRKEFRNINCWWNILLVSSRGMWVGSWTGHFGGKRVGWNGWMKKVGFPLSWSIFMEASKHISGIDLVLLGRNRRWDNGKRPSFV